MAFINCVKAYTSVEIIAVLEPSQHKGVHERCVGTLANIKKNPLLPGFYTERAKKKNHVQEWLQARRQYFSNVLYA